LLALCATLLADSGADVQTIQIGLGHSSLATTQLYLATRPKRLAEAVHGLPIAANTRGAA
jgi:site-specific recombinase XerD